MKFFCCCCYFPQHRFTRKKWFQKVFSLTNRMKREVLNPHYFITRSVWNSESSAKMTHEAFDESCLCPQRKCAQIPKQRKRPGWGAVRKPTSCLIYKRYQDWEVFKEFVLVWSEQFVELFLYLITRQQSQRNYEDPNLFPTFSPSSAETPETSLCAVTKATFTL